jgi:alkylhydroperoxidase family enzyme
MTEATRDRTVDHVWRLPDQLRALRPEAAALLSLANERAWQTVSPVTLEQVRLRVAALIGNDAGLQRRSTTAREDGLSEEKIGRLAEYYKGHTFSQAEKDCLGFVEQFVIDVSSLTEADVAVLPRHFSAEETNDFVAALYVTECTQRLEIMATALLGASTRGPLDGPYRTGTSPDEASRTIQQVLASYQDAVVRTSVLDPITTELVRLRCARTHNCRICKTLRLSSARAAGVDEPMASKVDFYEESDLDERMKLALRITDAFITRPDTLTLGTVGQARSVFSAAELATLCLDITKWSTQKIKIALGTDGADALPKNERGVSFFTFDQDGRVAGFSATPATVP